MHHFFLETFRAADQWLAARTRYTRRSGYPSLDAYSHTAWKSRALPDTSVHHAQVTGVTILIPGVSSCACLQCCCVEHGRLGAGPWRQALLQHPHSQAHCGGGAHRPGHRL